MKKRSIKILALAKKSAVLILPIVVFVFIGSAHLINHLIPPSMNKFQTLEKISTYANSLEEFPNTDNKDLTKPSYTSFYKRVPPTFMHQITRNIFPLLPTPEWTPDFFIDLLKKVTKYNESQNWTGDFILKFAPPPTAKFVVWGVVQGAFHSLIRDLEKLKEMNIINDKLEITLPEHYLIFNGDLVNRSPYSLETLTLVLTLIQRNPNKVIYIRGNHETEENLDAGLSQELSHKARMRSNKNAPIPFKNELLKFFKTLPLALFLNSKQKDNFNFIRISHYTPADKESLDETKFIHFLTKPSQGFEKLQIDTPSEAIQKGQVKFDAIITCANRSTALHPTNGLILLPQERGVTTWDILSAPTLAYKILHDFTNDAFTMVSQNTDQKWIISLYTQNVNLKDGFKVSSFDLISGSQTQAIEANKTSEPTKTIETKSNEQTEAPEPKSTEKAKTKKSQQNAVEKKEALGNEILVGTILGLSGAASDIHKSILSGMQLKINAFNESSTIDSLKIKLLYEDHQYSPDEAVNALKKLISLNVKIILVPGGTATIEACIPLIKEHNILVLFPTSGAKTIRQSSLKNFISLRTSYEDESKALMNFMLKKYAPQKIAFFSQNDSYGKENLDVAVDFLKQNKFNDDQILKALYTPNSTKVSELAKKIKTFDPDILILIALPAAALSLISALEPSWFLKRNVLGLSPLQHANFLKITQEKGMKITYSHVFPSLKNQQLKIMQNLSYDLKNKELFSDEYLAQGYISADILSSILTDITKPITNEKIIAKIESFKNYNFKGINLNFDETCRNLTNSVWIETSDGDWIEQK